MLQEIHMSTGIFLKLMTEAKSKGTGTKGNSKLLIKLLELFTDRKYSGMERTWCTIQKLSGNIALPDGFHNRRTADKPSRGDCRNCSHSNDTARYRGSVSALCCKTAKKRT